MPQAMAAPAQNIIQAIKDYGRQLFGFIRSRVNTDEDAEDILQEVWYQFSSRAEVDTLDSVSGWLYRVARNKITDKYRKKKDALLNDLGYEREDGEWQLPDVLQSEEDNPEMAHLRHVFWEVLFTALDELPANQREVFVLNELEDMTLQEIADMKHENIKTIISRKRYAVLHLRNRMENLYNDFLDY